MTEASPPTSPPSALERAATESIAPAAAGGRSSTLAPAEDTYQAAHLGPTRSRPPHCSGDDSVAGTGEPPRPVSFPRC